MSFSHFTSHHAIERKEMTRMVNGMQKKNRWNNEKKKKSSRRKSEVENSSTTATTNALYYPLDLLFECSLEIEIFSLSLSLSYALYTLSLSLRLKRNTVKKFPLRCMWVSSCHLNRVCGSELAIHFLMLRFMCGLWAFYASVFRLLRLFYVTCQQWWKETTRTKWMNFVVKQWEFFAILFFFAVWGFVGFNFE
jgi:hypothetical protein